MVFGSRCTQKELRTKGMSMPAALQGEASPQNDGQGTMGMMRMLMKAMMQSHGAQASGHNAVPLQIFGRSKSRGDSEMPMLPRQQGESPMAASSPAGTLMPLAIADKPSPEGQGGPAKLESPIEPEVLVASPGGCGIDAVRKELEEALVAKKEKAKAEAKKQKIQAKATAKVSAKPKAKSMTKPKTKGKAKASAKSSAKPKATPSSSKGLVLGCTKCRGSRVGCIQRRDPNFSGRTNPR